MSPPTALSFAGVTRRFGRLPVLGGVGGELSAGETLLVTGDNGSGKSTLLRCLAGLLAPDAGRVVHRERGRELTLPERRRRVGFLSPDVAFYSELTAGENLELLARLRRLPRPGSGAPAGEAEDPEPHLAHLRRLGLPPERRAGALSSGMRQRLRWAAALLHAPSLLLLDEPFQNLDAVGIDACRELLTEHLASGGVAVVADPRREAISDLPELAAHLDLGSPAGASRPGVGGASSPGARIAPPGPAAGEPR